MRTIVKIALCFLVTYVSVTISMDQKTFEDSSSKPRCDLMRAFFLGHFDMAQETIDKNPQVLKEYRVVIPSKEDTLPDTRFMPIHELVIDDNVEGVKFLLNQTKTPVILANQCTEDKEYTPLNFASSTAMIKILCQHGADIKAKNLDQETIVERALFSAWTPMWKLAHFLLKKDRCDINAFVDTHKNTLLHKAVLKNSLSVIRFLLERGANPDACNIYDISPLQIVKNTPNRDKKTLTLLEAKKNGDLVDCIIPNDNGDTPLHCAVNKRDCKEIESLISGSRKRMNFWI